MSEQVAPSVNEPTVDELRSDLATAQAALAASEAARRTELHNLPYRSADFAIAQRRYDGQRQRLLSTIDQLTGQLLTTTGTVVL